MQNLQITDDELAETDSVKPDVESLVARPRVHAVKHDVDEHVGGDEGEAAGETLDGSEVAH